MLRNLPHVHKDIGEYTVLSTLLARVVSRAHRSLKELESLRARLSLIYVRHWVSPGQECFGFTSRDAVNNARLNRGDVLTKVRYEGRSPHLEHILNTMGRSQV